MTANEHAARIASLSRELTAAMETFPRLNPKQQTSLAIAGDGAIERLYEAWLKFTSQQWRERSLTDHDAGIAALPKAKGTIEIG